VAATGQILGLSNHTLSTLMHFVSDESRNGVLVRVELGAHRRDQRLIGLD